MDTADLWTRILEASRNGDLRLVQDLLDSGADPNWQDIFDGYTSLHYAIGSGNESLVRLLIERDADIEHSKNVVYITPLGTAVLTGRVAMVRLLLDSGADATALLYPGDRSMIDVAEEDGSVEIASLLRRYASET
ncbi:ankyrin repeat domain-containing protein [Rubripirellula reticaptiva]|uniref:Ankyrin repeat protein n=1 Tax=Rubripirellula reticaptiva TaxID=2528013 RepID=A0A5C6E774_9BACT|nr:ankyrin repeat domain-containing protein [Rubripirellula reticaptiva]TWU44434.1 Ankyrin repeat protein [Rubripirellula reticaptiva]